MDECENNAADVIAEWQRSHELLQATNQKLETELTSLREARGGGELTVESIFIAEDGEEGMCIGSHRLYENIICDAQDLTLFRLLRFNHQEDLASKIEVLNSKIATLEESLSAREAELQARPEVATVEELEARCVSKEEELSTVSAQLKKAIEERDQAKTMLKNEKPSDRVAAGLQDELEDSTSKLDDLLQQKEKHEIEVSELSTNLQKLEADTHELKEQRDDVVRAKHLLESQVKDLETERTESQEVIKQWTGKQARQNAFDVLHLIC